VLEVVVVDLDPVTRILPGVPGSARSGRLLVLSALGPRHPAADVALLLVSELITNAVRHSASGLPGGTLTVTVRAAGTDIVMEVLDSGGAASAPHRTAAEPGAREGGLGILLVDALSRSWGTRMTEDGRLTWCRLSNSALAHAASPASATHG
jgi:anti-sigma regulatory factor (Ser/Thr protein kinase)